MSNPIWYTTSMKIEKDMTNLTDNNNKPIALSEIRRGDFWSSRRNRILEDIDELNQRMRQSPNQEDKNKKNLISETIVGLGRKVQVWSSPQRADIEGFGWNCDAILDNGVWTNAKTVVTHTDHPHKSNLD